MPEEAPAEKPKRKRGRPKGSKNKPKQPKSKETKPETQFKTKLGEIKEPTKEEPKPEVKAEEPKPEVKAEEPKKEEQKQEEKKEETAIEKVEEEEKPKPKEYTPEEIEEIAKKVETPSDNTPAYQPKYVLSPEYEGKSNYEIGIETVRQELEEKLEKLRNDPNANTLELKQAEEDLKTLDYLFENYYIGMNVFRTAKGGRDKLRE